MQQEAGLGVTFSLQDLRKTTLKELLDRNVPILAIAANRSVFYIVNKHVCLICFNHIYFQGLEVS